MIHSDPIGQRWMKTINRPVISSTPYAGLAIRSSMNLIPLRANPSCAGLLWARTFHTPYVMFAPTAVIADAIWMNLRTR